MNAKVIKKLVDKALKTLKGDWVLIGGTVLPLVGVDYRTTIDIDMISLQDKRNDSVLALMELAESLDLPAEAINSAGLFFLKKIPDWKKRLILHAESKTCRIFRPAFDLYLELKIARFSESDETDIYAYLKWHQEKKDPVNVERAIQILQRKIKEIGNDSQLKKRFLKLQQSLRDA